MSVHEDSVIMYLMAEDLRKAQARITELEAEIVRLRDYAETLVDLSLDVAEGQEQRARRTADSVLRQEDAYGGWSK
jgi:ElaB/YqjD/DUF883 family membrane-anchored ribosome-binding protein